MKLRQPESKKTEVKKLNTFKKKLHYYMAFNFNNWRKNGNDML